MTTGFRGALGRRLVWVWVVAPAWACGGPDTPKERRISDAGTDANLDARTLWQPPGAPCPEHLPMTEVHPTGSGDPIALALDCPAATTCRIVDEQPICVPLPWACVPGARRCDPDGGLERCTAAGAWAQAECGTRCTSSPLGAFCRPEVETTPHGGVVQYAFREPEPDLSDWSAEPSVYAAASVLVASRRGGALVDVAVTDPTGTYELAAPDPVGDEDELVVVAALEDGGAWPVLVARPEVRTGTVEIEAVGDGSPWSWTVPLGDAPPGTTILVGEAEGATALHLFDLAVRARSAAQRDFGSAPGPLVLWMRPGTDWSCGACLLPAPVRVEGHDFASQIFIPSTPGNRSDRLAAPIWHELGHWVMASFGVLPPEGGRHCLSEPTFPGQAWSEGWATAYSALHRDDPRFVDEKGGAFSWFDLESRTYGSGAVWERPRAAAGLDQRMDENEVAAMLWRLAADPRLGAEALYSTLAAVQPPFDSAYVARKWELDGCTPMNVTATDDPSPTLSDFLAAVVCGGAPPDAIDAVTEPETAYPLSGADVTCP